MTPGAPAAEDVFGQLAAMRASSRSSCSTTARRVVRHAGSVALLAPRLGSRSSKKGSDLMVRGRVDVDACSGTSEALPDLPG